MPQLKASENVSPGSPDSQGEELARAALRIGLEGLSIDMRGMPYAIFVGAFFHSFVLEIGGSLGTTKETLDSVRQILWVTDFDFQREKASRSISDFEFVG